MVMSRYTQIIAALILGINACLAAAPQVQQKTSHTVVEPEWARSPYFDTQFLDNHDAVQRQLLNDGFERVTFNAEDGTRLAGLFLEREGATQTIIYVAGFFPGRKEGMSTFLKIAPENCNILFFDTRGHGESGGTFWSNIRDYGKEKLDILAAMRFVRERTHTNIILHGVCAGAYNAAHAALLAQQRGLTQQLGLRGIVFDSGFGTTESGVTALRSHIMEKMITPCFRWCSFGLLSKEIISQLITYNIIRQFVASLVTIAHWFMQASMTTQPQQASLFGQINRLECPIFYIHSHDDTYAPINGVRRLAQESRNSNTWWINEPSKHACHHLKHKINYKNRITDFYHSVMA